MVVANLPYVPSDEVRAPGRGLDHEPLIALEASGSSKVTTQYDLNPPGPMNDIRTAYTFYGRFVANGDDFGFHQTIVRRVVDRYRRFVESVEALARWNDPRHGSVTST